MNIRIFQPKAWLQTAAVAAFAGMAFSAVPVTVIGASAAPPPTVISSVPLNVVVPAHPQVIIAVGNSNSMDSSDNIIDDSTPAPTSTSQPPRSAIMTWSGTIGSGLQNSSSPVNYIVPAGFTPPISGGAAGTSQPYTPFIASSSVPSAGYWGCYLLNTWTLEGTDPSTWYFLSDYAPATKPASPPAIQSVPVYFPPVPVACTVLMPGCTNGYPPSAASDSSVSTRAIHPGSPIPQATGGGGGGGTPPCGTGPGDSGVPCTSPPPPSCGPGSTSGQPCAPPRFCVQYRWQPPGTNTYNYRGDNSPSRLNVAKASISQVIQNFASETDFGLLDYSVSNSQWNWTWAYYMSPSTGFVFSNTYSPPASGLSYVNNPCHNNFSLTGCNRLSTFYGSAVQSDPYLGVAASGDDPTIDDVFMTTNTSLFRWYAFSAYNNPNPSSPSPTNPYSAYSLPLYNAGTQNIQITYSGTVPCVSYCGPEVPNPVFGAINTYPTNAGYVAFAPQVFYARRGWLQSGTVSASSGDMLVPVTSAGQNPTPAQVSAYVAQFTPFLVPENNVPPSAPNYSQYSSAIFSNAGQSPIAGMLSTAYSTFTTSGGPPSSNGCTPPRYVILMTDGLPTMDLSGKTWPPIGSDAGNGFDVTASFNSDGSLGTTNDQALTDTITELQALNAAGVKTFVVGIGPAVNDNPASPTTVAGKVLDAMAAAGGTGNYFAATSPAQVAKDMVVILNSINALNVSSVSGAVNTTGLNTGSVLYQASYTGFGQPYHDWTGDLKALPINATNGAVETTPLWSAQQQLDGQNWDSGRLIATWNPSSASGAAFRWNNLDSAQQSELQTGSTDTLGPDRLNYLRGDTEEEIHNGGTFRDRSHILGDITDSNTLYIGAPAGPYLSIPGYQAFETSSASRETMVYVGANDGMLHAFDATTGKEKFAFVPNGVFANLMALTNPNYNNAHQYYVDGSPAAGDVKFSDGNWHTVLAGGLGDGGNSIYALDVTNPQNIATESQLASSVLWEFTDANLGLTFSQPAFALTNDTSSSNANPNGFLVFFGSGYNNANGGANSGDDYLYAVNPQNGKLVAKIDLCTAVSGACSNSLPNGLSGVTVVNSTGAIGQPADTVYAGDLQGNLWKVNISDSNPSNWTVSRLFQAMNSSGQPQPITDTPAVSLHPNFPRDSGTIVYFGTGQYLGPPDLTNKNGQSFYAVWDKPGAGTATRAQLQQQVIVNTTTSSGQAVRTVAATNINWNIQRGWFTDLPSPGERVITNPRLFNGEVVFTTFIPNASFTCTGGGTSFLMVLNYKNGGAFPTPQLDINGNGQLNVVAVNGQNPVGIALPGFASAPTIMGANYKSDHAFKYVTLSTGVIQNVGEAGGFNPVPSWIQIK